MPMFYVGTDANKLGEVETDDTTGSLIKMTVLPVAPNPDKLPGKSPGGISTQYIVKHPTQSLVIALTSYWNKRPAHLTIFEVGEWSGGLSKSSVEASTAGREAVYGVFAPTISDDSDKVTLAVAHHNDGFVSFFQFDKKEIPESLMDQPAMTLELPEVEGCTKNVLAVNKGGGISIPSSHHILYGPEGKYVWIVDPNQSVIFTYTVDPKTGLPEKNDVEPSSTFTCQTDSPALGWFSKVMAKIMGFSGYRPRRIAISPTGEYIYICYETRNVIQVYAYDKETGKIDPENKGCLQEVSTIEKELTEEKVIGLTYQAAAEMMVVDNSLYVSNRGGVFVGAGKCENSIRIFDIKDGGRLAAQHSVKCSGPVRHFCVYPDDKKEYEILVAGTSKPAESLQTFRRKIADKDEESERYTLVGEADVGINIFCVMPAIAASADSKSKIEG